SAGTSGRSIPTGWPTACSAVCWRTPARRGGRRRNWPRRTVRPEPPRNEWHDRENRSRRHRGPLDRRGARALRGDGAPRRGHRGGAPRRGAGGDDPLRRVVDRAAGADLGGVPDREVPGQAGPGPPPSLPRQRRRPRRRRPPARGGLSGAPPRAHSRRRRLLGAVRPPEERRRRAAGAFGRRARVMIRPGSLVIVHLVQPTEKFWGILQELGVAGVMLRGINVSSFDDWMAQASRPGDQTLGLSTMFVPLFRVERIFLDEAVGEVESYRQRFR